jgi:hypothetical protein
MDLTPSPDEYEDLPEPVKVRLSRREYLWLSDAEKATLVQDECEPEGFSD